MEWPMGSMDRAARGLGSSYRYAAFSRTLPGQDWNRGPVNRFTRNPHLQAFRDHFPGCPEPDNNA
jgi:hypothetical protein